MSCGLMMLKTDLGVPATVYSDSSGETFQTGPTTQVRTVRKRRTEGSATAAGRAGPGRNRVHRKRSLGGMSRTDVRWGPRFSSTAPARTPHSLSIRFPRGLSQGLRLTRTTPMLKSNIVLAQPV